MSTLTKGFLNVTKNMLKINIPYKLNSKTDSNITNLKSLGFKIIQGPKDKINGPIKTEKNNMIIQNDNVESGDGSYRCYRALSYVSSGSKDQNNILIVDSECKKNQLYTRYSNDRIKYKAVMEFVSEGELIWTDHISLKPGYSTDTLKMRAIGRAYKLATDTIAILEDDDVIIIEKIKELHDNFLSKIPKEIFDKLMSDNLLTTEESKKMMSIILDFNELIKEISKIYFNKGEFSYWSRIWTLQEQHLSTTMVYCKLVGSIENNNLKLQEIMKSTDIKNFIDIMAGIIVSNYKIIDISVSDMSSGEMNRRCLTVLWEMLSGKEKTQTSKWLLEQGGTGMDSTLIASLSTSVRCSRNLKEANEAIAIALSIYEDDKKIRQERIYRKFIENGFIPMKKLFVDNSDNKGWLPGGNVIQLNNLSIYNQFYSTLYTQFQFVETNGMSRVIMNDGGSIVLKSKLIIAKITNIISKRFDVSQNIIGDVYTALANDKYVYDVMLSININTNIAAVLEYSKEISLNDEIEMLATGRSWAVLGKNRRTLAGQVIPHNSQIMKINFQELQDKYYVLNEYAKDYDHLYENIIDDENSIV